MAASAEASAAQLPAVSVELLAERGVAGPAEGCLLAAVSAAVRREYCRPGCCSDSAQKTFPSVLPPVLFSDLWELLAPRVLG